MKRLRNFDVVRGLLGIDQNIFFSLIRLMYFRSDENVRNLVGISRRNVEWLKHIYFFYARINPSLNLQREVIRNHCFKNIEDIEIIKANLIFKLNEKYRRGSIFFLMLVKNIVLECSVTVQFHPHCINPRLYIGISTSSQINKAMQSPVGWFGCGAALQLSSFVAVICNGKWSSSLFGEKLTDGKKITVLIDNVEKRNSNNNKSNIKQSEEGRKMNFFLERKKILQTITNIPSEGVHLGFSCDNSSFTLCITSLHKFLIPPPLLESTGMYENKKCIPCNFNGVFEESGYYE